MARLAVPAQSVRLSLRCSGLTCSGGVIKSLRKLALAVSRLHPMETGLLVNCRVNLGEWMLSNQRIFRKQVQIPHGLLRRYFPSCVATNVQNERGCECV